MKRNILLLLVALLPILANAYDAEIDGIYYYFSGDAAAVTHHGPSYNSYQSSRDGNSYSGIVNIPESVTYKGKRYSVTSIGFYAFGACTNLTSVTIPNSVTLIKTGAFEGCSSLTSIHIPNSVTDINGDVFHGTAWYNNQPNGLVYAGKMAYKYKGEMPEGTQITIADGTIGIATDAFEFCSGLVSIIIPNSVKLIGENAFKECTSLTSITIPNSVTSIGKRAFSGCI